MAVLLLGMLWLSRPAASERAVVAWVTPDPALAQVMDSLDSVQRSRDRGKRRFNPNYLTDYEGYLLSLDLESLRRIRHYRNGGATFDGMEELATLLKWDSTQRSFYKDRLYFPKARKTRYPSADPVTFSKPFQSIDLNRCTAAELEAIPGLGPVLSARIVRFRERLQGFRVVEQLKDVYGLPLELADRLIEGGLHCSLPDSVNRIDLFRASPSELRGFAYFAEEDVERIIRYRSSAGGTVKLEDIRLLLHFSEEKFNRIRLYLYE